MSRILLVDDDENLRQALQKTLESMGHQVLPAQNGRVAHELFLKTPVDVVISDIRMPEMDGLELTIASRTPTALKFRIIAVRLNPSSNIK